MQTLLQWDGTKLPAFYLFDSFSNVQRFDVKVPNLSKINFIRESDFQLYLHVNKIGHSATTKILGLYHIVAARRDRIIFTRTICLLSNVGSLIEIRITWKRLAVVKAFATKLFIVKDI